MVSTKYTSFLLSSLAWTFPVAQATLITDSESAYLGDGSRRISDLSRHHQVGQSRDAHGEAFNGSDTSEVFPGVRQGPIRNLKNSGIQINGCSTAQRARLDLAVNNCFYGSKTFESRLVIHDDENSWWRTRFVGISTEETLRMHAHLAFFSFGFSPGLPDDALRLAYRFMNGKLEQLELACGMLSSIELNCLPSGDKICQVDSKFVVEGNSVGACPYVFSPRSVGSDLEELVRAMVTTDQVNSKVTELGRMTDIKINETFNQAWRFPDVMRNPRPYAVYVRDRYRMFRGLRHWKGKLDNPAVVDHAARDWWRVAMDEYEKEERRRERELRWSRWMKSIWPGSSRLNSMAETSTNPPPRRALIVPYG